MWGLIPWPEIKSMPTALKMQSQPLAHQGSPYSLYFKVYIVWHEYCYSSFLLISICMEYLFLSPHFQCLCVPRSEMCLLYTAWYGSCFYVHSASLCLLFGAFIPFTLKVVISMYVPTAIIFIALGFFSRSFFLSLLMCSLGTHTYMLCLLCFSFCGCVYLL